MKRTPWSGVFPMAAAALIGAGLSGCGSNWRMHESRAIQAAKPSTPDAPTWVQGLMPMSEDYVFFIGRSHTPDAHREWLKDGEWHHDQRNRTPATRVGFTVMDERDAVQSARNDVYDQIRQRLSPRSFGMTSQTIRSTVDVGTCYDCGTQLPPMAAMPVQQPCNEACLRSGSTTWPNSASHDRCVSCTSHAVDAGIPVTFAGECCSCGAVHAFESRRDPSCASCPTEIAVAAAYSNGGQGQSAYLWHQPLWPYYGTIQGRDLSMINIGVESAMPAMLAHVNEEEVYFEKWNVHEGEDAYGRPFAEGRDEWQSYKCWILCSIPRAHYEGLVANFRGTYEALLEESRDRDRSDRQRRIEWEARIQDTELDWRSGEGGTEIVYDYYDRPKR